MIGVLLFCTCKLEGKTKLLTDFALLKPCITTELSSTPHRGKDSHVRNHWFSISTNHVKPKTLQNPSQHTFYVVEYFLEMTEAVQQWVLFFILSKKTPPPWLDTPQAPCCAAVLNIHSTTPVPKRLICYGKSK